MNPRIADYTTRKSYQSDYRKANREAINAKKRIWRELKKLDRETPRAKAETTQRDTP